MADVSTKSLTTARERAEGGQFDPKEAIIGTVTKIERKDGMRKDGKGEFHGASIEFERTMPGMWNPDTRSATVDKTPFKAMIWGEDEEVTKIAKQVRVGHRVQIGGYSKIRFYKTDSGGWQADKAINLEKAEFDWQKFYEMNQESQEEPENDPFDMGDPLAGLY